MPLNLRIKLEPPLPDRKFIFACKQRTVKELRNEIKRRIQPITIEPIALLFEGYELMDDDLVRDIFSFTEIINVHRVDSNGAPVVLEKQSAAVEMPVGVRKQVVISKRIHGSDGTEVEMVAQEAGRKKLSVEREYDKAAAAQETSGTDEDEDEDEDGDEDDSDGPPEIQPIDKEEEE
ncbi:hypothetical protein LPJ56_004300 [Coemansia sp. RSA 2599]|nr:hypothetical protein LPJ56_004300 [Coemansia sp. RSA 2599]